MSFKAHLIIISAIIVVVYLVWGIINTPPKTVATPQLQVKSPYAISVIHASWGLNCPVFRQDDNIFDKAYVRKGASEGGGKPMKDNVLAAVSRLCSGKARCEIPVSVNTFGVLPPADCTDKVLEVEYRCFSFDRPWHAKASSGVLAISCDDKEHR